jgi:hypothetical protein
MQASSLCKGGREKSKKKAAYRAFPHHFKFLELALLSKEVWKLSGNLASPPIKERKGSGSLHTFPGWP